MQSNKQATHKHRQKQNQKQKRNQTTPTPTNKRNRKMKCAQCKIDEELLIQGLCNRCAGTKNSEGSQGWCCECAAERDEEWTKTWNHTNDGVTCPECTFESLKKMMVACKECSKDVRKSKLDDEGICDICTQDKKMKAKVVCKICNVIHDQEERFVVDLCNDCLLSELKESKKSNNSNNNSSSSNNNNQPMAPPPGTAARGGGGGGNGTAAASSASAAASIPTTPGDATATTAAAVTPERYPLIGKRVAIEFDMVGSDPNVVLYTELYFGSVTRPILNAGNRVTAYHVWFDGYEEDDEDSSSYYSGPKIRKGLQLYERLKENDPAMQPGGSDEEEDDEDGPSTTTTATSTSTKRPAKTKRTHYPELIDAAIKRLQKNRTPVKLKAIQDSILRSRRDLAGVNAEVSKARIETALDMGVKNYRYSLKNGRSYEMYGMSKKRKHSSL